MTATAPQQKFMSLGDPRLKSLLLSWPAIRAAFPNTSDDELHSWVGGSELPWCFNLGLGDRSYICALSSVVSRQQSALLGVQCPKSKIQNWEHAVHASLPPAPVLLASILARAWNISADQMDLFLPEIGCVEKLYKPKETRHILRANAEKFLRGRAI